MCDLISYRMTEHRMKHIPRERMLEVASVAGTKDGDLDGRHRLSADESKHLRECSECLDVLGNTVREIIRNRARASDETV